MEKIKYLEEQIKDKKQLYQYCYEYCESVEWDNEKIKHLAIQLDKTIPTIRRYAKTYAIDQLKMRQDALNEKIQQFAVSRSKQKRLSKGELSKYNVLFSKLCVEDNPKKIIELIETADVVKTALKDCVSNFATKYYSDNQEEIICDLRQKIDIYLNYCKERNRLKLEEVLKNKTAQKKEQIVKSYLSKAQGYIKKFLEGDSLTKKEFCKKVRISVSDFDFLIEVSKKYDEELYKRYIQKISFQTNQGYLQFASQLKMVISLIKNGIVDENGNVRKLDLLDYYLILQSDNDTIYEIGQAVLTNQEMFLLRKFVGANSKNIVSYDSIEIKKLLNEQVEINCQKDTKGFPVPGTGRIVAPEEKQFILGFLINNKVPLNNKTYNIAFKRYLSGNLNALNYETTSKKI